jgi:hypothetical protein
MITGGIRFLLKKCMYRSRGSMLACHVDKWVGSLGCTLCTIDGTRDEFLYLEIKNGSLRLGWYHRTKV